MIIKETKLDFDDLNIVAAVSSDIDSRSKCIPFDKNGKFPLFTAPMDTVVSLNNIAKFNDSGIYPIYPRQKMGSGGWYDDISPEDCWLAIGLESFFVNYYEKDYPIPEGKQHFICVDIANGHMSYLCQLIEITKKKYGKALQLMVGNVANPKTYVELSNAGADYIRVGIGNGAGCLTTLNTGVGYPMASLIDEVYQESMKMTEPAYIVADGGMQKYSDIIKALALGADYVMVGSLFNKTLESAGSTFKEIITRKGEREVGEHVDQHSKDVYIAFSSGARFYKKFRGMSTKDVQKELGNTTIRTSEGVSRMRLVEYTLGGWIENFKHYLTTAMSYTGKTNLIDFIGQVDLVKISDNSFRRVDK